MELGPAVGVRLGIGPAEPKPAKNQMLGSGPGAELGAWWCSMQQQMQEANKVGEGKRERQWQSQSQQKIKCRSKCIT